jgi:hypothetical protein
MDEQQLAKVAEFLIRARRQESRRFAVIDAYEQNEINDIYVPKRAGVEYQKIVDQSRFNVMPLLVSSLANNFFIDGYRPARQDKNAAVWDAVWQANRMDGRQAGLWRAALKYGISYATVLPGETGSKKTPVINPWSPRQLTALYDNPFADEWPRYFMTVGNPRPDYAAGTMVTPVSIYDDNWRYDLALPSAMLDTYTYSSYGYAVLPAVDYGGLNVKDARPFYHGLGRPPAVRYLDSFGDLDHGPQGVIWPMLPAQRQLNQTTYQTLMAQQYAVHRQKAVAGLPIDEDEDGNPIQPFNVAVDTILQVEDPDVKFTEFSQTDISGYLDSRDKTLLYIASVRQIPPHTLVVGNAVSNISAEALAALEAGHQQDIAEHKISFGESAEQMLRLAGLAMDDAATWEDTSAQVRWRDTTPRSLAQVSDALGKMAQMLEVPVEELWEIIPDMTDQTLERWKAAKKKRDAERDSMAKLEGLMTGAQSRGRRADPAAPAAAGAGGGGSGRGRSADR